MLNDHKTYKILDKNLSQLTERKPNEKLAKLKREDKISGSRYTEIRSSDGQPPRLPKVHKLGYRPLPPIVSFIDSPI